jgi:uncharacterized membrane protein
VTYVLTVLAALGSALVAGIFFAFSSFIMGALERLRPHEGIAAMQSINIVVLNASFFLAFFGTAALCIFLIFLALLNWSEPGALWLLAGSLLYLLGCILVTMVCNVPLNNALARVAPENAGGHELWQRYLTSWTNWNTFRTAASLLAAAAFIMALH